MVTGITYTQKEVTMNTSIIYVGMDVHKDTFTLCCYSLENDEILYKQKIAADYKLVIKYVNQMRRYFPDATQFICGYEAGCLGYSLYNQLTTHGLECIILAPTTMGITNTNNVKTDRKDASNIARCLAFHTYSKVYIPSDQDNAIKEYIRMRDDHKIKLKGIKQQILSMVLRHGKRYDGTKTYWTERHLSWLKAMPFTGVLKETMDEYLISYVYLLQKIERFDSRILELANNENYLDRVKKLSCLIGIKAHTALSLIVEVGDFKRFSKAQKFSAYLGLVPSENSSADKQNRFSITKAGNSHLRRLLIESSQGYTRGSIGYKSRALKQRQAGNDPNIIAYADKANERLRRRFYRLTMKNGLKHNVAKTAIARELSCFIWGMMTESIA